jgi:hypothetical protein
VIKAGVFKCSVCGTPYELRNVLQMTPRQRGVRDAIVQLRRDLGRPIKTTEIVAYLESRDVNYSVGVATIKAELNALKKEGIVTLPGGRCSGWDLQTGGNITFVRK